MAKKQPPKKQPKPAKRPKGIKRRGRAPGRTQTEIYTAGEDGRIPELADAIDALDQAVAAWSKAAKQREEAASNAIRLLHVHKRTSYTNNGVTVTLQPGSEKLAVKRDPNRVHEVVQED